MHRYQLFIDGAFIDAERGEWIESEDPYKGTVWAEIAALRVAMSTVLSRPRSRRWKADLGVK